MTRVIEFIIALLIVVALFVLFAVFLPGHRKIVHKAETNHPVRQVYDTIAGFQRFAEWNPMRAHDPQVRYQVTGPRKGEGARLEYTSENEKVGSGSLEVVEAVEDTRVVIAQQNDNYGENKTHTIELEETGRGKSLEITWTYEVDYGWNLLGRFAGLYVNRNVGDDMKRGLASLTGLIATMPNFDYSKLEIAVEQVQPVNQLYVSKTAERNITAVQEAQERAIAAIERAMESANLEQAGPMRLVTTNFGSETYDFDVAIPVRPEGSGEAEGEADADADDAAAQLAAEEAEQAALDAASADDRWTAGTDQNMPGMGPDPCAQPVEPAPAIEVPELTGEVKFGQSYGGCALKAEYSGHPAALPLVRDMLRSYAASHGFQIHQRAYEEYLSTMEEIDLGDARFNIYWPVEHPSNPPMPAPAVEETEAAEGGQGEGEETEAAEAEAATE